MYVNLDLQNVSYTIYYFTIKLNQCCYLQINLVAVNMENNNTESGVHDTKIDFVSMEKRVFFIPFLASRIDIKGMLKTVILQKDKIFSL